MRCLRRVRFYFTLTTAFVCGIFSGCPKFYKLRKALQIFNVNLGRTFLQHSAATTRDLEVTSPRRGKKAGFFQVSARPAYAIDKNWLLSTGQKFIYLGFREIEVARQFLDRILQLMLFAI